MKNKFQPVVIVFAACVLIYSCSSLEPKNAQEVISRAQIAHNTKHLADYIYSLDFRERHYTVQRTPGRYIYTRSFADSTGQILDSLTNSSEFVRFINGERIDTLSDEWTGRLSNSLNSVLYFFQLPYTLQDPAVIATLTGKVSIKGQEYYEVEVKFSADGGGEDFTDVFLYWFHEEKFTLDFLAYSYATDGGGVRFRKSVNRSSQTGFIYQDYINYKPLDKSTSLKEMRSLYEDDKLVELSKIENLNVSFSSY